MSAFDWMGYLTLAEELATRRDDEAALRPTISRAYYAALGRASELLRAEGKAVSPLRTHATVWRAFSQSPDTRRAEVGVQLDRLRQDRNRADYDGVFNGDLSSAARDAVGRACRLVQTLDDVIASPAEDGLPTGSISADVDGGIPSIGIPAIPPAAATNAAVSASRSAGEVALTSNRQGLSPTAQIRSYRGAPISRASTVGSMPLSLGKYSAAPSHQ